MEYDEESTIHRDSEIGEGEIVWQKTKTTSFHFVT